MSDLTPPPLTAQLIEAALGFQRVLTQDPTRPEALVGISLVALASQQNDAAIQMAQAAVTAEPRLMVGWVTLGQALKAAGRTADAERTYRQAIASGCVERAGAHGAGRAANGRGRRCRCTAGIRSGHRLESHAGRGSHGPRTRAGMAWPQCRGNVELRAGADVCAAHAGGRVCHRLHPRAGLGTCRQPSAPIHAPLRCVRTLPRHG